MTGDLEAHASSGEQAEIAELSRNLMILQQKKRVLLCHEPTLERPFKITINKSQKPEKVEIYYCDKGLSGLDAEALIKKAATWHVKFSAIRHIDQLVQRMVEGRDLPSRGSLPRSDRPKTIPVSPVDVSNRGFQLPTTKSSETIKNTVSSPSSNHVNSAAKPSVVTDDNFWKVTFPQFFLNITSILLRFPPAELSDVTIRNKAEDTFGKYFSDDQIRKLCEFLRKVVDESRKNTRDPGALPKTLAGVMKGNVIATESIEISAFWFVKELRGNVAPNATTLPHEKTQRLRT